MLRGLFVAVLLVAQCACAVAQKKEIAQAKENIKAGKSLVEAEASMRALLAKPDNRDNEKIWLVLFDAVKKQYDALNEQMYLKHTTDTAKLFDTTYRMFGVLEGLDSVDAKPDDKGRVRLKYRKKHAEWLINYRRNILSGGMYFMSRANYDWAWKYFDVYVNSATQPLFDGYSLAATDSRLPRAAFYAVFCGYKSGNADNTLKYTELAEKDIEHRDMVMQYMADTYRTLGDTASCVQVLTRGFGMYPQSAYFFPHLFDYYYKRGSTDMALSICNDALRADSTNSVALLCKSSVLLALKEYDECVDLSNRLIAADSLAAEPYLNAGLAYFNQAVSIDVNKKITRSQRQHMNELYRKALPYMATYRTLMPEAQNKWALPLYTIYLNLNMGREFDEIDSLMKSSK